MGEKLDLLVFGDTAIDHFYEIDKFPKPNTASEVISAHRFYGGMGANTAIVASGLGLKTGLVSVIGTDAQDYIKYMENLGIKIFLKGVFGETPKSMFFKDSKTVVSYFYKGITDKLDELVPGKTFEKNLVRNANAIYLGRTYLNLQKKVIRSCRGKFVVYNPGYGVFKFDKIPVDFKSILKRTTVLILNEHELAHLNELGFTIGNTRGPKVFIVTKGKKGCSVYAASTEVDIGTYRTKVVDASGAGDAFNAGFITAQLKGHDIYDAARVGNATASFIVERWGCQTNIPDWEQVKKRLADVK